WLSFISAVASQTSVPITTTISAANLPYFFIGSPSKLHYSPTGWRDNSDSLDSFVGIFNTLICGDNGQNSTIPPLFWTRKRAGLFRVFLFHVKHHYRLWQRWQPASELAPGARLGVSPVAGAAWARRTVALGAVTRKGLAAPPSQRGGRAAERGESSATSMPASRRKSSASVRLAAE